MKHTYKLSTLSLRSAGRRRRRNFR